MIRVIKQNLLIKWAFWHFREAPADLLSIWGNFLRFSVEFFSIIPLIKTLITPWQRLAEPYKSGLVNLPFNFQVFLLNSFSRFLGFLVRSIVIIIGTVITIIVFIAGLICFVVWFVLPILIFAGIIFGFALLI